MTHLLTADQGGFLVSTKSFGSRSMFDSRLPCLTWWPHHNACCLLLAGVLMTAVNTAPGNVPLRNYPRLPKGVSWGDVSTSPDHHALLRGIGLSRPGGLPARPLLPRAASPSGLEMGAASCGSPPHHWGRPCKPFTRGGLKCLPPPHG